jgi:hypothetical protein
LFFFSDDLPANLRIIIDLAKYCRPFRHRMSVLHRVEKRQSLLRVSFFARKYNFLAFSFLVSKKNRIFEAVFH